MTGKETDSTILRQARMDDGPAAGEFVRALGLSMPDTPESIKTHWNRLWVTNPALAGDGEKPALGWVLEKDERMIGFFCNVARVYYFGERRVIVAIGSQWSLDKSHRRKIHRLAGAYFSQAHADILIATTANKSAGRIYDHYGARRIPQPGYDQALSWIIDGSGFIGAAMRRKNISPLPASALSAVAGPLIRTAQAMGWRRPARAGSEFELIGVGDIGDEFDDLWDRKRTEAERLLACRSSASLRWHLDGTQDQKQTRILVQRRERLSGFVVVMREDVSEIGLKRLRITDLFVEKNDPAVVNGLLCAAFEHGRQQGCHVLEWIGMPADLRAIALSHNPLVRALPTWPLFYKTADGRLMEPLTREPAWYITPYDGDTTLV